MGNKHEGLRRIPDNDLSDKERNELVLTCENLVWKVALKFKYIAIKYGVEIERLVSAGQMGLVSASRRWQPSRNVKFVAYAYSWVQCFVRREIYEQRWFGLNGLGHTGGNTSCDPQPLSRLVGSNVPPEDNSEPFPLLEVLTAVTDESTEDNSETINRLLMYVTPREREVLRRRFIQDMTLREVGADIGVSHERARQLERQGIWRIRRALGLIERIPKDARRLELSRVTLEAKRRLQQKRQATPRTVREACLEPL